MAAEDNTKSPDYQYVAETITGLAREGFSEISVIAGLLRSRIEHSTSRPLNERELYAAITAIACKADDIEDCIIRESEDVGIESKNPLDFRRECNAERARA